MGFPLQDKITGGYLTQSGIAIPVHINFFRVHGTFRKLIWTFLKWILTVRLFSNGHL